MSRPRKFKTPKDIIDAWFVEAKVKPNTPTQKQLEFIERMRGLGCVADVAYSMEEAAQICGTERG